MRYFTNIIHQQNYNNNTNTKKKLMFSIFLFVIVILNYIPYIDSFSNNILVLQKNNRLDKRYYYIPNNNNNNNDNNNKDKIINKKYVSLLSSSYGKGSEIWPESPDSCAIKLSDSFPNGFIPLLTQEENNKSVNGTNGRKRDMLKRGLSSILSSSSSSFTMSTPFNPVIPSLILLVSGVVKPIHILTVVGISGYIILLQRFNKSVGSISTGKPSGTNIPSLPPQGHVPDLVSNPLNELCINSTLYKQWKLFGFIISYAFPSIALLLSFLFFSNTITITSISTPLFLLSCQLTTEIYANNYLLPLPLQILIPILYNTIRLPSLWNWVILISTKTTTTTNTATSFINIVQSLLAYTNALYWFINLFTFLIPVAAMRFMRSYFFCIEASEVTLRKESQNVVGL